MKTILKIALGIVLGVVMLVVIGVGLWGYAEYKASQERREKYAKQREVIDNITFETDRRIEGDRLYVDVIVKNGSKFPARVYFDIYYFSENQELIKQNKLMTTVIAPQETVTESEVTIIRNYMQPTKVDVYLDRQNAIVIF